MTLLLAALLAAQEVPRIRIEALEAPWRPGKPMSLRITIENGGAEEARLEEPSDWLEGLEVRGPDGRVVKATGKLRGITKRTVAVEPGGFFGRTVDVAPALAVAEDGEGEHVLKWSFGEASSPEIRVLVRRVWLATVVTSHGDIEIELLPEAAPAHVRNFMELARSGFYERSTFHRIIPGFMMQGGAPADASKKSPAPLKAEFNDRSHVFGTVSMARTSDPDSATSQFFICFAPAPHLDGKYSVFGRVVGGEEVVRKVEKVESDHTPCACGMTHETPGPTACCGRRHKDLPKVPVTIKEVTLRARSD